MLASGSASLLGELVAAIDQDASVVDLRALFAEHAQHASTKVESAWYTAEDDMVLDEPASSAAAANLCAQRQAAWVQPLTKVPEPLLLSLGLTAVRPELEPTTRVPGCPTLRVAPAPILLPKQQLGMLETVALRPPELQTAPPIAEAEKTLEQELSLF